MDLDHEIFNRFFSQIDELQNNLFFYLWVRGRIKVGWHLGYGDFQLPHKVVHGPLFKIVCTGFHNPAGP